MFISLSFLVLFTSFILLQIGCQTIRIKYYSLSCLLQTIITPPPSPPHLADDELADDAHAVHVVGVQVAGHRNREVDTGGEVLERHLHLRSRVAETTGNRKGNQRSQDPHTFSAQLTNIQICTSRHCDSLKFSSSLEKYPENIEHVQFHTTTIHINYCYCN